MIGVRSKCGTGYRTRPRLVHRDIWLRRDVPVHPPLETAVEYAHPVEAPPDQNPRQTGAGGFARSGAVEDQVPIPGKVVGETMEGGRAEPERTGDHLGTMGVVVVPAE